MLKLHFKKIILTGLLPFSLITPAFGDDLEVTAVIDNVTVFLRGAEVTRVGMVTVPAGEHRLLLSDLPPGTDPARLRLTLGNSDIRLGNLQLEELFDSELVGEEEQRLQNELDELFFDRQGITDEIESANTQLRFLDSLASGAVGGQQAILASSELAELLETLASSSNQARQVIRDANQRIKLLDLEIEQKRLELSQVATRQRSQQLVTAVVEVSESATTDVSITYPVNQARWTWLYEARLDTETRNLELQRKVSVAQTTGENWDNVEINITTARPNQNTLTPELGSLLVDIFRPQPIALERSRLKERAPTVSSDSGIGEVIAIGSSIRRSDFNQASSITTYASVAASQYLVDFQIPGRVSIDADSQPQILPIDQRKIYVDLVTRVVPDRDSNAYLEARFTLEDTVPLQSGVMQLYRDGSFIGRRLAADFLPQEEVSLPFGQDERVRVETRPEQQESRGGGTFRRSAVDDHRVSYEVTSFHNLPIELEILARVPVSQNEAIEVETGDETTPYDEEDVDGNRGVVLWRRQAEQAQPIEIKHYYTVSYPRDDRLQYQDN